MVPQTANGLDQILSREGCCINIDQGMAGDRREIDGSDSRDR